MTLYLFLARSRRDKRLRTGAAVSNYGFQIERNDRSKEITRHRNRKYLGEIIAKFFFI